MKNALLLFALAVCLMSVPVAAQVVETVYEPPSFEVIGTLLSINTGDPEVDPGVFITLHANGGNIEYLDCLNESPFACPAFKCDEDHESFCLAASPQGCYRVVFSLQVSTTTSTAIPTLTKAYLLSTSPCGTAEEVSSLTVK